MRRENFKHGLVRRIESAVFHWDANTEANVEAVTQIDVAQLTNFNRQAMCFSHGKACFHHFPTQAVAQVWR